MNTAQLLNVTFDVWCAVFSVILIVGAFVTRRYNRSQAGPLICGLCTNTFLNIFEVLSYVFRGDPSALGWLMVRISNFAVFLGNHLLLLFGCMFILRAMERNGRVRNGQFKRVFTAVIVVGIALLVLSQFFGFYYAFDEQNRYYRKDGYGVMVVLLWLATIALLALTLANWKHYTLIERVSFVVLEVLPVIAMIAQLFTYGISLTTFASTISLLMLFMTYEVECSQVLVKNERKLLNEVIAALAEAVDAKDTYTRGHSGRVAVYARMLAERMELTNQEIERVYRMALLHDVGKIGIPDAVLNKPGKLTDEEFALIKSHTVRGGDILGKVQSMPELSDGARWHHERFDGRGYPDGMRGEDIPLEARIICVADCYDAMTSDRVYRKHLSQEVVRREIEANTGTQFDPQIARLMLEIIDEDKDYQLHE